MSARMRVDVVARVEVLWKLMWGLCIGIVGISGDIYLHYNL